MLGTAAPRFDDQGQFLGYIGSLLDIDERREIEQRLQASEARLRIAAEAAAIGTWDMNPLTGHIDWDAHTKELFGLPSEAEITYDVFLSRVHPDDRELTDVTVRAALSPEGSDGFDMEYRTVPDAEGRVRWLLAKGRAILEDVGGKRQATRFLGIVMDITERKRTEAELRELTGTLERRVQEEVAERARTEEALRQSQKLEAIGQLTGGVAHDFNNLLTVIRSSVYLLRQPGLNEEKRERYLSAIRETADRAAKLTNQLLAFARRQPLKPEVFDAAERIRASLDLLQTTAGTRVTIETDFPDPPYFVEADVNQFETALLNLTVNARDAMTGKGTLLLRLREADAMPAAHGQPPRRGPFVALEVADTGSGIAPDVLPRIFEPFYTTKEVGRGTGLGLSQVYGFVKQSGGEILVDSQPGRGTTFTLYLPRAEAAPPASRPLPADESADATPASGRVLLVEDNRHVGEFTAHLLEQLGFDVVWRLDVGGALALLSRDPHFDVVLSDIVMPGGMTGLEMAREIERRHPGIPVVLMTGYSHALAEGDDNPFPLLRKPFTAEELSRRLTRTLRRRAGR